MSDAPGFLPWLGTMPIIDSAVQQGNGAAAAVTGSQYSIYRLNENSGGSVFDGTPLATNFPMYIKPAGKNLVENDPFNLQVKIAICDNRILQLGDILVETGYESEEGNIFIVAQIRPTNYTYSTIVCRAEATVSVTRPQPLGGQSGQQPQSGWIAAPGYMGIDKQNEFGMVLQDGGYFFTQNQLPSLAGVPAGLSQLNRIRDGSDIKIPTAFYREHFVIYVPLLTGIQIQEFDNFNFPNSDRYKAASVYTSEATGFSGYICICEKMGT
jgi:hypothetical protein